MSMASPPTRRGVWNVAAAAQHGQPAAAEHGTNIAFANMEQGPRWSRRERFMLHGIETMSDCAWCGLRQLRLSTESEGVPRERFLSLDTAIQLCYIHNTLADVVQVMSSSNKAAVTAVTKQQ